MTGTLGGERGRRAIAASAIASILTPTPRVDLRQRRSASRVANRGEGA